MNNLFACMWCYISAWNSIHSLQSWLRSTSLDSAFHLDFSMKPFAMLFAYILQVIPKEIQVRMQKMQLQGHAATKLFITFNQIWHHYFIAVSSMISKKSFHHHSKSLPSISLQIRHLFLQLFRCQHSSYLWPHKYTTFNFCFRYAWEHLSNMAKGTVVGFKALTNCLASPSLICNGGSKILVLSIRDEIRAWCIFASWPVFDQVMLLIRSTIP